MFIVDAAAQNAFSLYKLQNAVQSDKRRGFNAFFCIFALLFNLNLNVLSPSKTTREVRYCINHGKCS